MATPKTASMKAESSLQFCDGKRSDACLRGFGALFEQQVLCDVTLEAQGEGFGCHKAMLAASSPYFQVRLTFFYFILCVVELVHLLNNFVCGIISGDV